MQLASDTNAFHRRLFGRLAPVYARWWKPVVLRALSGGGFDEELAGLLELRRPRTAEQILDVGCGPGNFTTAFARLISPGHAVGLDTARQMLEQGRRAARAATATNVSFVQADAQALPVRRESVSVVNCCGVLHLLPRPDMALREMAAALRPGGVLLGMTLVEAESWPQGLLAALFGRVLRVRFFTLEGLGALLSAAGLRLQAYSRFRLILLFQAVKP